ncbi:ATP-binding cassette sub-family A member 3, partial [Orchesella cincta]
MEQRLLIMDNQVSPENTPPDSPHGSPHRRSQITDEDSTRIWDDLPKHLKIKKRSAYIRRHSDLTVTSNYRKFTLLMWKNYINTKRKWKTSAVQLTAPAFLVTILVIINSHRLDHHYKQTIYDPFKIDVMPNSTFGNACDTIYLKPQNKAIEEFKNHLQLAISCPPNTTHCRDFKYKFSDDDLDVVPYKSDLCAMIEFIKYEPLTDTENITSNLIKYQIRFPGVLDSGMSNSSLISIGKQWDTSFRFPPYLIDGPREIESPYGGHPGYYQHGFLYIQHLIAMEIAEIIYVKEKMKLNTSPPIKHPDEFKEEFAALLRKLSVRLRRFPFPSHRNEGAVRVIHDTLPVVLVTGFGISCMVMVYLTVHEKEMGIRILLKMYGIDQTFHRYAWILHNLIMLSVSSLIITAILSTNWTSDGPGIFNDVVSHVFLLLIVCYVFCLICTVLLIVCFFSRASTACISVCFIWTVTFVPYIYVRNNYNILHFWQRIVACFFFNTAIAIGCHIISEVEALDEGLNWSNVFSKDINDPMKFSLGWVMVTMVLMGFVKFLLAQYLAKVFPDSGIQSLPWNFLFTSWFWNDRLPPDDSHIPYDRSRENSFEEDHPEYFEDDSNTKRRKELTIENVSKYHGKLRAVHKMNLICHQGHVTVLLGDQGS